MTDMLLIERSSDNDRVSFLAVLPAVAEGQQIRRIPIGREAIVRYRERYGINSDEAAIDMILRGVVTRVLGVSGADVTIAQGTPADLPATLPREPTDKEALAAAVVAAKTLDEVKVAITAWAQGTQTIAE